MEHTSEIDFLIHGTFPVGEIHPWTALLSPLIGYSIGIQMPGPTGEMISESNWRDKEFGNERVFIMHGQAIQWRVSVLSLAKGHVGPVAWGHLCFEL